MDVDSGLLLLEEEKVPEGRMRRCCSDLQSTDVLDSTGVF